MASLVGPIASGTRRPEVEPSAEGRKLVRDSLIVTLGGQLERALGTFTSLALRWGLDPDRLGVYSGLKLFLDNTNRSSLGVGLGAVQEIPILRAAGRYPEARHLAIFTSSTSATAVSSPQKPASQSPIATAIPEARDSTMSSSAVSANS